MVKFCKHIVMHHCKIIVYSLQMLFWTIQSLNIILSSSWIFSNADFNIYFSEVFDALLLTLKFFVPIRHKSTMNIEGINRFNTNKVGEPIWSIKKTKKMWQLTCMPQSPDLIQCGFLFAKINGSQTRICCFKELRQHSRWRILQLPDGNYFEDHPSDSKKIKIFITSLLYCRTLYEEKLTSINSIMKD